MLSVHIYDTATKAAQIADLTHVARGLKFSADKKGFATLSVQAPNSFLDAFNQYDRAALRHVVVSWNALPVWEGRLEDPGLSEGKLILNAFGYRRALGDVPYTALWSKTNSGDWFPADTRQSGSWRKDRFEFDNNNRLYITAKKGEVHGNSPNIGGTFLFALPQNADRLIQTVSFDYDFGVGTGTWKVGIYSAIAPYPVTDGWASVAGLWTTTTPGTGTQSLTLGTPRNALVFNLFRDAANAAITDETDVDYLKITNLRIKTTTSGSVYADEIAKALVAHVNGINPTQLQASTALIESPGVDLTDEIYEDMFPDAILDHLVALGDNATPPGQWEWGVFDGQLLHFRPRGSAGRALYVDLTKFQIQHTLDRMRNSAYAVYRDASGRTLRTANADDAESQEIYEVVRRDFVKASTTSATQAQAQRDAFLDDRADPMPRAGITFDRIYDASGAPIPNCLARPGDTVTARNLPPLGSQALDRIRTFLVSETHYAADGDQVELVPDLPAPTLERLLARVAEGV